MIKNTLQKKIDLTILVTTVLTVAYFIIALSLNYESLVVTGDFKQKVFYELLKDTLTLTATFLAPVAAFVLFSDWREEHRVKSSLDFIDEVKKIAGEIEVELFKYSENIKEMQTAPNDKIPDPIENFDLSYQLGCFSRIYLEIDENNESLANFKKIAKSFGYYASKSATRLRSAGYAIELYRIDKPTNRSDTSILSLKNQYQGKLESGENNLKLAIEEFEKLVNEIKIIKRNI